MPNMRIAIASVLAAGLAAACSSTVVMQTSHDITVRDGVRGDFRLAAAGRDIETVVVGNPFAMEQAAFEQIVLEEMHGKNLGQPANFTTTPDDTANPSFRVIVHFGDPSIGLTNVLCRAQPTAATTSADGAPRAGRIGVAMAFCNESETLSWVVASIGGADGPTDPAFRNLIAQSTYNMIPLTNEDPGDGPRV